MRIDYLMKPNIYSHEGYEKQKLNFSVFISHKRSKKLLITVNSKLKVYKVYKNDIFKSKTILEIDEYFSREGYKKI